MALVHINAQTASYLKSTFGIKDLPENADLVTGDKGDEMIIIQGNYREDGAEASMIVITPDKFVYTSGCAISATGTSVVPECEIDSRPTYSEPTVSLTNAPAYRYPQIGPGEYAVSNHTEMRNFMAALDASEVSAAHRGALNPDHVAELRRMMGLK